jgi:hypothetical protein
LARANGLEPLTLPELGQPYDFALTTAGGRTFRGREFRGKVVVLLCWAAWSKEAAAQRDALAALYGRRHAEGLEVIGIDLNNEGEPGGRPGSGAPPPWAEFRVPLGWPERELWVQASEILALPRALVLDRRGLLRADTPRALGKAVEELLGEP